MIALLGTKASRFAVVALALLAAAPVHADEADDALATARERAAAGDTLGADAAIEALRATLLSDAPLAVREVVVLDSPATGLGIFKPRATTDYRNGDTMTVYVEPVGFGYGDDGLGNNLIDIRCDVILLDESGAEISKIDSIGQLRLATRAKPRDLFLNIDLSFNGSPFPLAAYTFNLVLTDTVTGKSVTAPIKFRIIG